VRTIFEGTEACSLNYLLLQDVPSIYSVVKSIFNSPECTLFNPFGKLARRAIYFSCINFFFNDRSETNYLRIHWTNRFSQSFHQTGICSYIDDRSGPLFSNSLRDVAMAINFGQNWQNDLHSAGWRSAHTSNKYRLCDITIRQCWAGKMFFLTDDTQCRFTTRCIYK